MSTPNLITIVDAQDHVIVRQKGLICRIVRVIITNPQGQILVQQRSANLQDNPSKWDWSATGHVDAGEDYLEAALRETAEEVGITHISLQQIGKYYDENRKRGLMLRRFNAVYRGETTQTARHDPSEVAAIRWITPTELTDWLASSPEDFTPTVPKLIELYQPQLLEKN
jgi:isopentenyldiphosphate isomerase